MNNPKLSPFCADHCLEILMSDLPTNIMKKFTKEMCKTGPECTLVFYFYFYLNIYLISFSLEELNNSFHQI